MPDVPSTVPLTKPQPVVFYGAILAALVSINGGLVAIFKDNPTAMLWLGVTNVILGGLAVFKDQIVKAQVVPLADTASYLNEDRQLVPGPAAGAGGAPADERGSINVVHLLGLAVLVLAVLVFAGVFAWGDGAIVLLAVVGVVLIVLGNSINARLK